MSLVDKDHMTELRPAAAALETALTANDEIQLKAVAFAINHASNTGETRVEFLDPLRPATKEALESKGYKINNYKSAKPEGITVISWKPEG